MGNTRNDMSLSLSKEVDKTINPMSTFELPFNF